MERNGWRMAAQAKRGEMGCDTLSRVRRDDLIQHLWKSLAVFCGIFLFAGMSVAQGQGEPIRLSVDLRDAAKHIFHSRLNFPVKPGPLTLVYPKWIPGEHSPTGPIVDLTGLKLTAGGKEIAWRRDDVDLFAFHMEIPAGADALEVKLDYLSPADTSGGRERPASTSQLAILNWFMVSLYPQGAKPEDLTYAVKLRLPAGWKFGTALTVAKETAEEIE